MSDSGSTLQSFSAGSDRFFNAVRTFRPEGGVWFPSELRDKETKRKRQESLHEWFCRVVEQLGPLAPESLALEPNIGLLATIKWVSGTSLTYANIQVIIANSSLQDYYYEPTEAFYLRLDCDKQTLGDLFTHPHPHLHIDNELGPRFALDAGTSENVVVDFIEFLYRHYKPDLWLEWASTIWDRDFAQRRPHNPEQNPLPRIIEAFQASEYSVLRSYGTDLAQLKSLLTRSKQHLLNLRLDSSERELLGYPLAR